jgi:arsenite oxidase small subunit
MPSIPSPPWMSPNIVGCRVFLSRSQSRQRRNPEISSMSNSPRADCFIDPQQEGESRSLGEGCPHLVDLGRRHFLKSVAMAATVAVVPRGVAQTAGKSVANTSAMSPPQAGAVYPSNRLGTLKDLQLNTPIAVTYPDSASPGVLLKLGHRVEGGVGPDADIVAFSTLCAHKGYPLNYNATSRTLNCPGHYSVYDVEKGGLEVWGHAAQNLAQFRLRVDANTGDIFAEGVDELIYGRTGNVLA